MITGHVVFTGVFSDSDEEVSIGQHTYGIYAVVKEGSDWVTLRLNGGPHEVLLPPASADHNCYTFVPGDYTSFEVVTGSAVVSLYAIG